MNIVIEPKHREGVIELLNAVLADEYVLSTKLRNYHWNVVGPRFNDLQRATTLGGHAVATLAEFVHLARLKEHPAPYPDAREMLANVLGDHEMQRHEKMAWMVRAFLQGKWA